MMGFQTSLDLFHAERKPFDLEEDCIKWLREWPYCVGEAGIELAKSVFGKFGKSYDSFDRCRAIPAMDGRLKCERLTLDDADMLGLLDESVNSGTVCDRAWAMRKGMEREDVARLLAWDYRNKGEHVFERSDEGVREENESE